MSPENMDEWGAAEWSIRYERPRRKPKTPQVESDDDRFARAKDVTPKDES